MSNALKRRLEKLIETTGLTAEVRAEIALKAAEFDRHVAAMAAQVAPLALSAAEQAEAQAHLDAIIADVRREIAERKVRA